MHELQPGAVLMIKARSAAVAELEAAGVAVNSPEGGALIQLRLIEYTVSTMWFLPR